MPSVETLPLRQGQGPDRWAWNDSSRAASREFAAGSDGAADAVSGHVTSPDGGDGKDSAGAVARHWHNRPGRTVGGRGAGGHGPELRAGQTRRTRIEVRGDARARARDPEARVHSICAYAAVAASVRKAAASTSAAAAAMRHWASLWRSRWRSTVAGSRAATAARSALVPARSAVSRAPSYEPTLLRTAEAGVQTADSRAGRGRCGARRRGVRRRRGRTARRGPAVRAVAVLVPNQQNGRNSLKLGVGRGSGSR
jgi:hypothetical protein